MERWHKNDLSWERLWSAAGRVQYWLKLAIESKFPFLNSSTFKFAIKLRDLIVFLIQRPQGPASPRSKETENFLKSVLTCSDMRDQEYYEVKLVLFPLPWLLVLIVLK